MATNLTKPILGYWDFRGRAAIIRYLLHYKNVDFEDKQYPFDNYESWFKEKFSLGLAFPNLPYYIDGEVKLTQSVAIMRYLARKYDMDGQTDQQKRRVELAEQQIVQLRQNMRDLCHNKEFDKIKPEFLKNLQGDLKRVEDFLGDSKFIAGDKITYVDFMFYEVFDTYCYLENKVFKDHPRLEAYYKRIKSLPSMVKYCSSPAFKEWPIFSTLAVFGCKKDKNLNKVLPPELLKYAERF